MLPKMEQPNSISLKNLPSELIDLLINEIDKIEDHEYLESKISHIVRQADPTDLAKIAHYYSPNIVIAIYKSLPSLKDKSKFLSESERHTAEYIINFVQDKELNSLLSLMDAGEISDILEQASKEISIKIKKAIDHIDTKKRHEVREIMSHDENSVARFMSTDFISLNSDDTVFNAIDSIKKLQTEEIPDSILVTSNFGELIGKVTIKDLIINEHTTPLISIISGPTYKVLSSDTRETIISMVEHLEHQGSIPVVDYSGAVVGILTPASITEMLMEITSDTLSAIGGSEEHDDEFDIHGKVMSRAPWLFMTLASGLLSATVINVFNHVYGPEIAFAVCFIPLITGMSGNIGIQSSTVIVRGIAVSGWSSMESKKIAIKESLVGLIIGITFGSIVGLSVFLLHYFANNSFGDIQPTQIGITVGIGLCIASVWASMIGVVAPLFFSYIGIDPAVSAGPMVTALNDIVAMIIYLSTARVSCIIYKYI